MYAHQNMVLALDARLAPDADAHPDKFTLIGKNRKFDFKLPLSPAVRTALDSLGAGRLTAAQTRHAAGQAEGAARIPALIASLARLGLLSATLTLRGTTVARLVPLVAGKPLQDRRAEPDKRYMVSRFALLRRVDGHFILESPLSFHRVELLHPAGMAVVAALARPTHPAALDALVPADLAAADDGASCAAQLLDILLAAGLVDEVDAGQPGPQEDTGLRQWEFHDLLFHARSRPGRTESRLGRTFRFLGDIEPTPALRQPRGGPLIALGKPDIAQLRQSDVAFTEVLEARRSIRKFGSRALTLEQLGQFLYRTARVRAVHPADGKKLLYESTDRPYPSGGGCYELEIYAVVDRCEGLAQGVYRYDPLQHGLEAIESKPPVRNTLLDNAARANGAGECPQVLFVLTARFQRLNWKYETMAYAAILKNVGVLYQTMYLVATAMGLAPCALGAGDPELLGAITGDAYWMESSVGEFMLGSLPDQPYSQF